MRISDWSSDVCSSDLLQPGVYGATGVNLDNERYLGKIDWNITDNHRASLTYQQTKEFRPSPYDDRAQNVVLTSHWYDIDNVTKNTSLQLFSDWTMDFSTEVKLSQQTRSEEHTSELQSLMRLSYAVFCLKKKPPKQ